MAAVGQGVPPDSIRGRLAIVTLRIGSEPTESFDLTTNQVHTAVLANNRGGFVSRRSAVRVCPSAQKKWRSARPLTAKMTATR
jgi:hypothetical protein